MSSDNVEVTVRNSSGQQGDEVYMMNASSTIQELKAQISQRHPQHPTPELQRLIFCGRILNNEDTISSMGPLADGGNKVTVLLYFRSSPASPSPPPAQPQAQPQPPNSMPQFAQYPNLQVPPQGMPFGQGMYPVYGAFPLHAQAMPLNGPQGQPRIFVGPGMMPNQGAFPFVQPAYHAGMYPGQFAFQQVPVGANGVPQPVQMPHRRVVAHIRFNPKWLFYGLLLLAYFMVQSGPTSFYWSLFLFGAAFLYLNRGGRQGVEQNAAGQQNAPGGAQAGGHAPNGNGNEDPAAAAAEADHNHTLQVPAIFRYDWRHHRGIIGDHPDVVRRRQEEQAQQQQEQQAAPEPAQAH